MTVELPLLSELLTDPSSVEVWDPADGFTCARRGNKLPMRKTLLSR